MKIRLSKDHCFVALKAILSRFEENGLSEADVNDLLKVRNEQSLWMLELPNDEPPIAPPAIRKIRPMTEEEKMAQFLEEYDNELKLQEEMHARYYERL